MTPTADVAADATARTVSHSAPAWVAVIKPRIDVDHGDATWEARVRAGDTLAEGNRAPIVREPVPHHHDDQRAVGRTMSGAAIGTWSDVEVVDTP